MDNIRRQSPALEHIEIGLLGFIKVYTKMSVSDGKSIALGNMALR